MSKIISNKECALVSKKKEEIPCHDGDRKISNLSWGVEAKIKRILSIESSLEIRFWFNKIKGFLGIEYPLTEKGKQLKSDLLVAIKVFEDSGQLESLIRLGVSLPTVREPRDDLFKELPLDRTQKDDVFGQNLAVVKTSQGCSSQCIHCADLPDKKLPLWSIL